MRKIPITASHYSSNPTKAQHRISFCIITSANLIILVSLCWIGKHRTLFTTINPTDTLPAPILDDSANSDVDTSLLDDDLDRGVSPSSSFSQDWSCEARLVTHPRDDSLLEERNCQFYRNSQLLLLLLMFGTVKSSALLYSTWYLEDREGMMFPLQVIGGGEILQKWITL